MRHVLLSTMVVTFALCASASGVDYVVPVLQQLHARATASDPSGSNTSAPPDVVQTGVPGFFTHSATANSPFNWSQGNAGLYTWVRPDGLPGIGLNVVELRVFARASRLTGDGGLSATAESVATVIVDVPSDLILRHNVMLSGMGNFQTFDFTLTNDEGVVFIDRSFTPAQNVQAVNYFIPADRYIFTATASDFLRQIGPGGGEMITYFTVVPEPATVSVFAAAAVGLLSRRRRR
jgi:hypothetical protein